MSATVRGKHSSRYGDSDADEQRQERELERGGVAFEDNATNRGLKFERLAEIAAEELFEIVAVLREKRLIEIQGVAQLGNFSGRGAFPEHLLDSVARNKVNQEENQGEDEPERRESQQKALQEVARHQ
jgi:hypothetical protein